jgi:hypothetical protein
MELDKILLTKDECYISAQENSVKQAQCLKLLKWLADNHVVGKNDSVVQELWALLGGE